MRTLRIFTSLLVFTLLVSSAQAQTGDWQSVENLPLGARISVLTRHRVPCILVRVNDDDLVCAPTPERWFGPDTLTFQRQNIREIRLPPPDGTNELLGAAIGGGIGATVGAANSNCEGCGGARALIFGGILAVVGAKVAKRSPIVQGKLVYKR